MMSMSSARVRSVGSVFGFGFGFGFGFMFPPKVAKIFERYLIEFRIKKDT